VDRGIPHPAGRPSADTLARYRHNRDGLAAAARSPVPCAPAIRRPPPAGAVHRWSAGQSDVLRRPHPGPPRHRRMRPHHRLRPGHPGRPAHRGRPRDVLAQMVWSAAGTGAVPDVAARVASETGQPHRQPVHSTRVPSTAAPRSSARSPPASRGRAGAVGEGAYRHPAELGRHRTDVVVSAVDNYRVVDECRRMAARLLVRRMVGVHCQGGPW
jgi:hypothetical protein